MKRSGEFHPVTGSRGLASPERCQQSTPLDVPSRVWVKILITQARLEPSLHVAVGRAPHLPILDF